MLPYLQFGVTGLPCPSTTLCGDDTTAGVGSMGVVLVKISNGTSVPSALIVSLAAAHGTNATEPTSSRLEGVDGVGGGGGDVKPRLFEECVRAEGWDRRSN